MPPLLSFSEPKRAKKDSKETFAVPYKQTNDRRDKPGSHS